MAATAAAPTATTSPQRPNTNSKFTVYLRSSDRSGTLKVRLPKRKTAQAVLRAFAGAALGDASKAEGLHLLHPVSGAPLAPKSRIGDVARDGDVLDVSMRPPASPHATPPRSPQRRSLAQERSALRTREMVRESTVAVDSMRARLSAMGILKAPRSPPQTPLDLPPPSPRRPDPREPPPRPRPDPHAALLEPSPRPRTAAPDPHAALREELAQLARTDAAAFEALVEAARREGMS